MGKVVENQNIFRFFWTIFEFCETNFGPLNKLTEFWFPQDDRIHTRAVSEENATGKMDCQMQEMLDVTLVNYALGVKPGVPGNSIP